MAAAFSFTFFVLVDCRDKRDGESGVFSKESGCVILVGKCDTEPGRFGLLQYAAPWATMLWNMNLKEASAHATSSWERGCISKIQASPESKLKS